MDEEMDLDSRTPVNTEHDCGRNSALAFGSCLNGELGAQGLSTDYTSTPTRVNFPKSIRTVLCGESHTIFILYDGTCWSCGSNDHYQLGHDNNQGCPQIVEGLDGREIVAGSAGYAHNLLIDRWGTLFSFGSNSHGQCGHEFDENKPIKRPKVVKSLATKVICQVAAGYSHSVVLTNAGEIYVSGSNKNGQLGLGIMNGANQAKFCEVDKLLGFPVAMIVAGGFHTIALSVSGSVYAWGKNNDGQLGVGDNDDRCQPTQLATLRSLGVKYIATGFNHSAFLTYDGGVFTSGNGSFGRLGHSSTLNEVLPRKILEFGSTIIQVTCGRCHTLCLAASGKLYTFGLGSVGQLGAPKESQTSPLCVVDSSVCTYSTHAGGDKSFLILQDRPLPDCSQEFCLALSYDHRNYVKSFGILTISESFVTKCVNASEPVDQDLMVQAETLFASPSCWNASFLLENDPSPCTWKNMGVDLVKADNVLSRLSSICVQSLKELIDQLLFSELTSKLPHQLQLVEILRVYVLLPLTPSFYTCPNNLLVVHYADRLHSLNGQMISVVTKWIYNSPKDQLVRLISVYKKIILNTIDNRNQTKPMKDYLLKTCLKFLSLLNNINRNTMKISYHTFNIPLISEKIDVRDDYLKWVTRVRNDKNVYFSDYPFILDAVAKTHILQIDQFLQMQNAMNSAAAARATFSFFHSMPAQSAMSFLLLTVSRNSIVQDTLGQLRHLNTHELKKPLKIKILGEEAEDSGGVKKEFFMLLLKEILDPKYGMFHYYEESRLIWFSQGSFEEDMMFFLIGLICGLAIYNFTIINLPFPLALFKKLLNEKVDLNDLREITPTVASSLEKMLLYENDDLEEVFCMNFEISYDFFGEVKTVPLKPDGSEIPVTKENRYEFVERYISHFFHDSVKKQFDAFNYGFQRVCESNVLQMFYAQELQDYVVGNEDYDWGELERHCSYKGYKVDDITIKNFWEVFHEMTQEEKKEFLLFLTGCDRIPILGMKQIKMVIEKTQDDRFLPVAHTCFNLLDLPAYQTKERLRYKLLQAIKQNTGFSLV